MQTIKFLFLAFLDFISAIFLGAAIGFVLAIGPISVQQLGVFRTWRLLDSSVKFTQIVDATAYTILANSTEGKVYEWNNWDCQLNAICTWMETNEINLYRDEESTTERNDDCQHENLPQPRYKPGTVVECVFTMQTVSELSPIVYYAILDDGTIWSWPRSGAYEDRSLFFLLVFPLIGGLVGIVAGIVVVYRKEASSKYG